MISPETTLTEVAFLVGDALHRAGIPAVLSGGGAASVYAPEVVQSLDLDFVLAHRSSLGVSARPVTELGFRERNGAYEHPETRFTLEFLPGPPKIGDEEIADRATLRRGDLTLSILTPTDCVRDRLSWFLFYRNPDFAALAQALAVAERHPVDLDRVRGWALGQGAGERYAMFAARLAEADGISSPA